MITRPSNKDILADSLLELLQTTPIQDISVAVICKNCQMSSRTFYNYFKDKHEAAAYIYSRMERSCREENGKLLQYRSYVKKWNRVVEENYTRFLVNTLCYKGQNNIRDVILESGVDAVVNIMRHNGCKELSEKDKDVIRFYCVGVDDIIERRILSGKTYQDGNLQASLFYAHTPISIAKYIVGFDEDDG